VSDKAAGSPRKFRSVPSAKKVLLIFFWDMKGPASEHYQEKGQTVKECSLLAMLEDKLKPAVKYDNARPTSCGRKKRQFETSSRGSATSTLQSRPRTLRLSCLWST
jgi:hypothetical protein